MILPSSLSTTPTLCLNMIVKNESKVIRRLLESVAPFLDSYCICDTGSTDDTIDIIRQFFQERHIPGEIVQEPFRDFGHNRTVALQAAARMPPAVSEYLLLMDADMVLWHHPNLSVQDIKRRMARFRVFHLFQGTDTYHYKNVRIVKNRMNITYWGVTHEYVKLPEGETIQHSQFNHDELFIRDIGDGGCKSDKFARDIALLKQGLIDIPNNDRYTFYLANSYRDHGDVELAIEMYRKRIALGGWIEEIWQSYNSIARCCMDAYEKAEPDSPIQKQHIAQAIFYWLEGFHAHPKRIENLYYIVQYYRKQGHNQLAYHFFRMADQIRTTHTERDFLFTQLDIYTYKLDYELSIIGYYCNPDEYNLARVSMNVLRQPLSEEDSIYKNVLSNYKFYAMSLSKYAFPMCTKNTEALARIGRDIMGAHLGEYVSSSPSMCFDAKTGDLVVCVRFVNYRINAEGGYEGYGGGGQSTIGTKNIVARFAGVHGDYDRPWRLMVSEHELICDPVYNDGRYRGLEDVRLFSYDKFQGMGAGAGRIIYNANRGLEGCSVTIPAPHDQAVITVEHGWIVPEYGQGAESLQQLKCTNSKLLVYEHANPKLEKNWALFGTNHNNSNNRITLKCVYSWSPLVLGTICPTAGTFTETHRFPAKDLPYFFKDVRCSTCGVNVGTEIWFIGHLVSYEDRRYYYHIMIVLDGTTLALKKYTPLWTFDQEKVEYTLGMVFFPEQQRFLIGYSVMDRETKFIMLSKHIFDDRMMSP